MLLKDEIYNRRGNRTARQAESLPCPGLLDLDGSHLCFSLSFTGGATGAEVDYFIYSCWNFCMPKVNVHLILLVITTIKSENTVNGSSKVPKATAQVALCIASVFPLQFSCSGLSPSAGGSASGCRFQSCALSWAGGSAPH